MINYTGVVEAPVFFSRIFTEKVVGVVECDTQKVIHKKCYRNNVGRVVEI